MTSLLEALEQKYGEREMTFGDIDDSKYTDIAISIFVPCRSPRALVPSLLVLNDCDITTAGDSEALVAKCSCVEELDLAKNKLHDWPEVSKSHFFFCCTSIAGGSYIISILKFILEFKELKPLLRGYASHRNKLNFFYSYIFCVPFFDLFLYYASSLLD